MSFRNFVYTTLLFGYGLFAGRNAYSGDGGRIYAVRDAIGNTGIALELPEGTGGSQLEKMEYAENVLRSKLAEHGITRDTRPRVSVQGNTAYFTDFLRAEKKIEKEVLPLLDSECIE